MVAKLGEVPDGDPALHALFHQPCFLVHRRGLSLDVSQILIFKQRSVMHGKVTDLQHGMHAADCACDTNYAQAY